MIHVWDVLGDQLIDAARLGDLTVVCNILDGGQVPVDFVQADRWTALFFAAHEGKLQVVTELLTRGANVCHVDGWGTTAIHWATENGHLEVVQELIRMGADVNDSALNGNTPLHLACIKGNIQMIHWLLSFGADSSISNQAGETAAQLAYDRERFDIVQLIQTFVILPGIDIVDDLKLKEGILSGLISTSLRDPAKQRTLLLHKAMADENLPQIKILVEFHSDIDSMDVEGNTALHLAAREGAHQILSYLISQGAHLDAVNTKGMSPLHLSASNGSARCVSVLVEAGADLSLRDKQGNSAFMISTGDAKFFLEYHATCSEMWNRILSKKPVDWSPSKYREFKYCRWVEPRTQASLLHAASRQEDLQVCKSIIEEDFESLFARDGEGRTPLHHACKHNCVAAVRLLLDSCPRSRLGSLLMSKSKEGRLAIHEAAANGQAEVLGILIESQRRISESIVDYPDSEGRTSLMLAVQNGADQQTLICLIQAGADVSAVGPDGKSVLQIARGSELAISSLVESTSTHESLKSFMQTLERVRKVCLMDPDNPDSLAFKVTIAVGDWEKVNVGKYTKFCPDEELSGVMNQIKDLCSRSERSSWEDLNNLLRVRNSTLDSRINVLESQLVEITIVSKKVSSLSFLKARLIDIAEELRSVYNVKKIIAKDVDEKEEKILSSFSVPCLMKNSKELIEILHCLQTIAELDALESRFFGQIEKLCSNILDGVSDESRSKMLSEFLPTQIKLLETRLSLISKLQLFNIAVSRVESQLLKFIEDFLQHSMIDNLEAQIRKLRNQIADELEHCKKIQLCLENLDKLCDEYLELEEAIFEQESEVARHRILASRPSKKVNTAKEDLGKEIQKLRDLKCSKKFLSLRKELFRRSQLLPEITWNFDSISPLSGTCAQGLYMKQLDSDFIDVVPLKEKKIFTAIDVESKEKVVLKEFQIDESNDIKIFRRVANLLVQLRHPGVIELRGIATDLEGKKLYLVFPFFSRGDLRDLIESKEILSMDALAQAQLLHEIVEALNFVHGSGAVHRDIKPENIFVSDDGRPVLADFDIFKVTDVQKLSLSTVGATTAMLVVGTPGYLAPEIRNPTGDAIPYSSKSDMYAFGVLCSEVFTRKRLESPTQVDSNPTLSAEQKDLLRRLLHPDPHKRLSAHDALAHEYLKGMTDCIICFDSIPLSKSVSCGVEKKSLHSLCLTCFKGLVESHANADLADIKKTNGQLRCPHKESAQKGCEKLYSHSLVATSVPSETFIKYMKAQERIIEEKTTAELEVRMKKEMEELMKMDERKRLVHLGRMYITDEVLNLSCPRCKAKFLDFNGCFALTCSRCNCGFCAWCLMDCGVDAHAHVRDCPDNLMPGKDVFGDVTLFETQHALKRRVQVIKYLTESVRDRSIAIEILRSVQPELRDLGIEMSEDEL